MFLQPSNHPANSHHFGRVSCRLTTAAHIELCSLLLHVLRRALSDMAIIAKHKAYERADVRLDTPPALIRRRWPSATEQRTPTALIRSLQKEFSQIADFTPMYKG
jgi:hypothetical protein